jgi:hypothetical protein
MELLHILRALVRMRLLVCAGLLLAAAIGLMLAFEVSLAPPALVSRATLTGVAAAHVQIDTGPSLIASGDSDEFPVLEKQAGLLADLMASRRVEADIARRAGVVPAALLVVGPSMLRPLMPSPLAVSAAQAAAIAPEPHVLRIDAIGSTPLLRLTATAPSAAAARRLADAGIAGITAAATGLGTPGAQRLVVRRLGPTRVAGMRSASKLPMAAAAATVLFAMWCGGLIVLSGVIRRRRRAAARTTAARDAAARGPAHCA